MARGKAKGKDRHGPNRLEDGGGGGGAWLTTYADAITLLMAFFMMLYAMSQVDQVKFEKLIAGFAVPFGNDSTGQNAGKDSILDGSPGLVGAGSETTDPISADEFDPFAQVRASIEVPMTQVRLEYVSAPELADVSQAEVRYVDASELLAVRDRIAAALDAQGWLDDVRFELAKRGLVVSIATDDVLFEVGSAEVRGEGREIVAALAPILSEFANQVVVEGHTDDQPLRRGGYSNWNLSTDRAVAVVDLMAREYGLAPQRLGAAGFGEFRPVGDNQTPAGRAANRRVELVILTQADGGP